MWGFAVMSDSKLIIWFVGWNNNNFAFTDQLLIPRLLFIFQLPPSGANSSSPSSPAAGTTPPAVSEVSQPSAANPAPSDAHPQSESKPQPAAPSPSQTQPLPAVSEDPSKDTAATLGTTTAAATAPLSDRQSPATPQPARTPGSEEVRSEAAERTEGVAEWV